MATRLYASRGSSPEMARSWRIKEKDQVLHQVHHPFSSRLGFHQGYLSISSLRKSVFVMGFWQI
jgi:hypothetical protein